MSVMNAHICTIVFGLGTSLNTWAADPPPPPANRTFKFDFMPFENRSGVGIFASCGVGNLPFGIGAKYEGGGSTMCDDNMGGPGDYKERFVHDGYLRNNTHYLLEQDEQNNIFHQVLIDYAQNWKMEVYIATDSGTAGLTQAREMSGGKNDGHVWPIDPRHPEITGTGSGDPKRVQWRMLVEGEEFSMDMLKNSWDKKPSITQNVSGQGMNMTHTIDMTNSNYSQMNIPAVVTTTLNVDGFASHSFDSRKRGGAGITGGRFMITRYSDYPIDPHYDYWGSVPDDYGKNLDWLDYWNGSEYWNRGDPYGYPDGDFKEGSTGGF